MKRYLLLPALCATGFLVTSEIASAQFGGGFGGNDTVFRPRMIGGGNASSGECNIRVRIDQDAEVTMRGDRVAVRVFRGNAAYDEGSTCTAPLPSGPMSNLDVDKTDGRGRVEVISRPDQGNVPLVVRISDTSGGADRYVIRLRWQGASGGYGYGNGGYGNGGYRNDPYNRNDPYYGDTRRNRNDPYYEEGRRNRNDPYYDQTPGNRRGRDRTVDRFDVRRAISDCQNSVSSRVGGNVGFRNVQIDNSPGRNDYITGQVISRNRAYNFACRVDLATGNLRSVDVDRR